MNSAHSISKCSVVHYNPYSLYDLFLFSLYISVFLLLKPTCEHIMHVLHIIRFLLYLYVIAPWILVFLSSSSSILLSVTQPPQLYPATGWSGWYVALRRQEMKPFIPPQLQPLYQKQLGFFIAAHCLMNSFCVHRIPSYLNKYTHAHGDSQHTVSMIVFIRLRT